MAERWGCRRIMILSYEKRYIFFHMPKTAGSSVASFLARHLGPDDLMADTWGDALEHGGVYNKRFYRDIFSVPGSLASITTAAERLQGRRRKNFDFIYDVHQRVHRRNFQGEYAHACAEDVRRFAPSEFNSFFKFGFVRNPFSHALSLYRWRTRTESSPITFSAFLRVLDEPCTPDDRKMRRQNKWEPTGWQVISIDDLIILDHVARMENLISEMSYICDLLEIKFSSTDLPHAKKLSSSSAYREYYTKEDRRRVERLYQRELETFNYDF